MTSKSKSSFLVLLLFLLGGALVYGEYSFGKTIMELRRSIESLTVQRTVLERTAMEQTQQISVFKKALAELETYQLGIPANEVDFYSLVQKEMEKNGLKSNIIRPVKAANGRSAVEISYEGPYLSFVPTLSDWRSLKVAVRVSSVTMQGGEDLAIKGNVILESVLGK